MLRSTACIDYFIINRIAFFIPSTISSHTVLLFITRVFSSNES